MYLIIGASGFIGKHIYDYCIKEGIDVLGTYYSHPDKPEWIKFDICTDDLRNVCQQNFHGKIPDAVILCGANASIDSCKMNEEASKQVNIDGMQRVIQQMKALGVKCVFLSSEAVFDGNKGMYQEEDAPNPITVYGKQKLKIEEYIAENLKEYLILRVSRATGSRYGEKDILQEFYSKIRNHEEIGCLKNQSFCVTEVNDIAAGIVKALDYGLNGLYHLSSANYTTRYELAKLYAEKVFGGYQKIVEKEYKELPFLDKRHIYGGLLGSKLETLIGIHFLSIDEIIRQYIDTLPAIRNDSNY